MKPRMKPRDLSSAVGRSFVLSMYLGDFFLTGELQLFIDDEQLEFSMPNHHGAFRNAFLDLMVWDGFREPSPQIIGSLFSHWAESKGWKSFSNFERYFIERDFLELSKFIYNRTLFPRDLLKSRTELDLWESHGGWNGLDSNEQTLRYLSDSVIKDVVDQSKNRERDHYWIHLL